MKTFAEMRSETRVPVVIANHRGTITEVNDRFAAVFGWTRDEIIGQRLDTIIQSGCATRTRWDFRAFFDRADQPFSINHSSSRRLPRTATNLPPDI